MYAVFGLDFAAEAPQTFWSTSTFRCLAGRCLFCWIMGNQSIPNFLRAAHRLMGVNKMATNLYHPNSNGAVERVNHTIVRKISMVVNKGQKMADLAPNEVYIRRLPQLPPTIFERPNDGGYQSPIAVLSRIATSRLTTFNSIIRTISFAKIIPSPSLTLTAGILFGQTPFAVRSSSL